MLPQLFQFVPRSLMEKILDECQVREQRCRKLPALLVMILCIVMHWFSHESLAYVLQKLILLPALLQGVFPSQWSASKGSISEARYRLGAKPLHRLFKQVCRPQATPTTPGAFRFGKRLVALDGTVETVADSPENAAYFGRSSNSYGESAYPQVRCIYLSECGTHIVFDAGVWPYQASEKVKARRLLRSLTSDMLVLIDRGLTSAETLFDIRQRGADFVARVEVRWRLKPLRVLKDGAYLAEIIWADAPQRPAPRMIVRVIAYTLDDPQRPGQGERHRLITSLLDPDLAPALELVEMYHERWEVEITLDEIDTHERVSGRPFRSQKPLGVIQEIYGLLLSHFIVRCWMLQTAQSATLDPDRLSFVHALRVIRDSLLWSLLATPSAFRQIICHTLAYWRLPPRDGRIHPRVVKRRQSKFERKRPIHNHPPQPTIPFREAVRLCYP